MRFVKMQGIGNDYIYIDCLKEKVENPGNLSKKISDRHYGVGSDGLILIKSSDKADCKMEMYNADGSQGEMCGNGIRCVGKYVYDHKLVDKTTLTVETLAGIKTLMLQINSKTDKVEAVTVNMGEPILEASKIPVQCNQTPVIDMPVISGNMEYFVTCVSMGNPHAVIFSEDIEKLELSVIGPLLETNSKFPNRINTEFIQIVDRNTIKMRVWERGSGETLACGTGACASVVAAILKNYTNRRVKVELLGGTLIIEWKPEDNCVYMTGEAKTVFYGEISDEEMVN